MADDEPLTAEDEAAIGEAREQTARGEAIPAAQVYRELFGEEIASGRRCQVFDNAEEFIADLDREAAERAEGA